MTGRALRCVGTLIALGCASAGCSSPRLLTLDPPDRLPLDLPGEAPVRLALTGPADARPEAERRGREPRSEDMGVVFVGEVEVERGSVVTGDGDLGGAPLEGLASTLRRYLRSIDGVQVVDPAEDAGAGADYVLEVEVLHLAAAAYESRRELDLVVVDWFVDPQLEERFLPVANAVLRLRLRSADGRFRAERVVNAGVLGGPADAEEPGDLVAGAARAAGHQARQVVASWLRRARTGPDAPSDRAAPASFLVHAVDVNRTGVLLARVDRATGDVLWLERREGLPLVGAPGVWHLSPFDEHGVLLAPAEYAALSQALSAEFGLQRLDQLTVYRYLGPLAR